MNNSINTDATDEALVSFRNPTAGACVSKEMMSEIAGSLVVKLGGITAKADVNLSKDSNNIATLDASNAVLVPAVVVYADTQTLAPTGGGAATSGVLIFTGWPDEIDATVAFMEVMLYPASDETGVDAVTGNGTTGTAVKIRPDWELVERVKATVRIRVFAFTKSISLSLRLAQLPIPSTQS